MIKTIKIMLAGLLVIPIIALSVSALAPSSAFAACDPSTFSATNGAGCAQGNGQQDTLFGGSDSLFTKITNVALFLIGAISVLMLIYGGIRYTISGGDTAAVTSAKNTILYAIVGIVVALLAYAIVNFVLTSLVAP